MRMMSLHPRPMLAILAIAALAKANHGGGTSKGWIRHPSNLARSKSTRRDVNLPITRCEQDKHQKHGWNNQRVVSSASCAPLLSLRGGSDAAVESGDDTEKEELERQQRAEEHAKLVRYRTEQHLLYQLRSTYLTEMLASRGVPLPTVASVSTADGERPPEKVDWDCALSTHDDPKSCLYSFDAEPDTKVVAPVGTDAWISISALNRLRRTDPSKVEPMWHSRYSILQSWFSDESEFSMLQHVGPKGFVISSILLDGGNGMVLRSLLILAAITALVALMPLLEYVVGRLLVSAPFWSQWRTWSRVMRAGFPLKLLLAQLAWKGVASAFGKVEGEVRDYIVDMECEILEESVPITVGVGAEEEGGQEEGDNEDLTEQYEEEDSEEYDEYDNNYDDDY